MSVSSSEIAHSLPPQLMRATVNRQGAAGRAWLAGLPTLLNDLMMRYELTIMGKAFDATKSLVVPVMTSDGRSCVLKVCASQEEYATELAALRHWTDCAAVVKLQAWDLPARALLLARVQPGHTLNELPDDEQVVARLAECAHTLWSASPAVAPAGAPAGAPAEFPSLAEHLRARLLLARQRIRAGVAEGLIDESDFKIAVAGAQKLLREPGATLLHTDLHGANVLDAGSRLQLIDPEPCVGDPCYDAATYAVKADSGQRLTWRANTLAEFCRVDAQRVLAWSRVVALDELMSCAAHDLAPQEVYAQLVPFVRGGAAPDA